MSPVGLRSEKGCAGVARQKLKSTDQGRPTSTNPKLSKKNNQRENGKTLVSVPRWVPDTKTDWPTVGSNMTLTLTLYFNSHV
jgi:hypothetical protein